MTDEIKETEVIETKKTKKQEKRIEVTIIASNDGSSLVEYLAKTGEAKRCYIPVGECIGGSALPETLEAGIEYGANLEGVVSSETIAAMHNYGIWTKEDILGYRGALIDALTYALVRPAIEQLTEFASK